MNNYLFYNTKNTIVRTQSSNKKNKGMALAIIILILPVLALLAIVALHRTSHDLQFASQDARSKKAFYLAEAGLSVGLHELSAVNYSKYTHMSDGITSAFEQNRLPLTFPGLKRDGSDGWYYWEWKPGDSHRSFTDSQREERFRFKVYFTSNNTWVIESEGILDKTSKKVTASGTLTPVLMYAIFSDGDMGEFVRGVNQQINGWVHANGNLYIRPTGSTLTFESDRITSAGRIIRHKDAWDRPDQGGTVRIRRPNGTYAVMNGASQGASGEGNAFDSYHPGWLDSATGAMNHFGGVVKDSALGGSYEKPPALESMADGGYYNQQAGLVVTPSTPDGNGISERTFYNNAEERREIVKELDMSVLDYPSNGLIYANTPIRLVNAHKLKAPLMIVSNSNIYTIGDVNKEYGDKEAFDSGTSTKQPLALMSTQRIYHLSASWRDDQNQNRTTSLNQAAKPPLYDGDAANVVEINAALVDGSILVDEINYVKQHGGESNPFYTGTHSSGVNAWANSDDLLERWGNGVTLRKRGSIIHLENSNMAKFDNSDAGPGVTAWVRRTHYTPPRRDYGYDSMFSDPTRLPPFSPLVSRQNYWNEIN